MKLKFVLLVVLLTTPFAILYANPYLELKNTVPFKDHHSGTSTSHLRLGYKFDNNFYVEGGAMSHGSSYEAGYKFKKRKWTLKGKWEGSDSSKRDYFKSKIETELRYTFGD